MELRNMFPAWTKNWEWRDTIAEEATRKSLDLPDKKLNIDNRRSGVPAWALVLTVAGMAATGLGTSWMQNRNDQPKQTPTVAPEAKPAEPKQNLIPIYPEVKTRWSVKDGQKVQEYSEDDGPWLPVPADGRIVVKPKGWK